MAEEGQVIGVHTAENWKKHTEKGNTSTKLIVVDLTATWCDPCRLMSPIFEEYAKEFLNVTFLKVDVDELQTVTQEFEIKAMPTFLFLKQGVQVDKG
ncbi:thioredoxin H-type-like [Vicia villosa]|uniref:thioredoxin H-type-like n=1 Tax=Vicia villosa TaxID=3911 RepID=UPI00273BCD1B|nr:thioredoxin H-type-like [Vicia villosa]